MKIKKIWCDIDSNFLNLQNSILFHVHLIILKIVWVMIIAFVGISVFSGLMGILSVIISQENLENAIAENLQISSNQVMDKMERDIVSKIKEFKAFSNISEYQQIIINSNLEYSKMDNVDKIIEKRNSQWIDPGQIIAPFMADIINNKMSTALQEEISFYEKEEGYRVFGEVFVTNAYGVNVAQTGKTEDFSQNDEDWWQEAKKQGVFVEDVQYDPSSDVYSIDIGIRINDAQENFIGVMKVVLNVEELIHIIQDAELNSEYDSLKIGWFDKDGIVIYDPHLSLLEYNQQPDFFSQIDSDQKYFFFTPQNMEPQLFTFTVQKTLKDFGGLGWILVTHLDTAEVYYSANQQKNYIIIITVIVAIISSFIGIVISRNLSKPILDLRKFADQISVGKPTKDLPLSGPDEIQDLTADIKKMKDDLENQKIKLIAAERMSAIGELAARISHDIRNPLSNIKIAKELLSKQIEPNEKNKENLKSMERGIERITHQVESVLGHLKNIHLEKNNCELDAIMQNVISSINIPKNIKLNFLKTSIKVNGNSDALFRIFQNLILNSIQAIEKEKGDILIEILETDESVIINVQDSGEGISKDKINRIFEPLYTTKLEGTGLGLSTVKNLVEQHQGKINFKNNPTTFTIILPKSFR